MILGREFTGKRKIDGKDFKMVIFYGDKKSADDYAEKLRRVWYARVIPMSTVEFDGNVLEGFGVYRSIHKKKIRKKLIQ